ncbi:hypothetical protein ACROAH_21365 [Shewanella oncorhynchi]|uniref:hypothetical protein n=1 Tax=Shewanella oncorhynchi TaxID=2726434 RepID=UPI003D7A2927
MIIANKNGWLIAAELKAETPKYWDLKPYDEPNTRRILKSDKNCQVFTEVKSAEAFVLS